MVAMPEAAITHWLASSGVPTFVLKIPEGSITMSRALDSVMIAVFGTWIKG
jgi:hypothetical protein